MRFWRAAALAAGFVTALCAQAGATVVARASIADLRDEATHVVHARVVDRAVVPTFGPRGEIRTRTTLRVLTYLKGAGPATLTVQQLGGTLDGLTMHVEGNARLEPGDEVVAFLDVDAMADLAYVVGLAQGVWHVDRTPGALRVARDLEGLAFYRAGAVEVTYDDPPLTLTELWAAIGVEAPSADGAVRR